MRLGVIDIGSNTVHLLVVDAHRGAQPIPTTSHKLDLRIFEHLTDEGAIAVSAQDALVAFIQECLVTAEDLGIEELMAFATSAVREAPNGAEVIARVADETGLFLRVLPGEEEARLTFLAARRWFGWSSGRLLMVDIGGGSLELAAGLDEEPDAAVSLPLGVGRVTRALLAGDPPPPEVVRHARREIRQQLAAAVRPLAKAGPPDRSVGTSKTMRSLARALGAAPSEDGPYAARQLERAALGGLVDRLARMTAVERAALPGISPSRAPALLAGALVAEAALDLLGIEQLEICPWALREGIILDRLDRLGDLP